MIDNIRYTDKKICYDMITKALKIYEKRKSGKYIGERCNRETRIIYVQGDVICTLARKEYMIDGISILIHVAKFRNIMMKKMTGDITIYREDGKAWYQILLDSMLATDIISKMHDIDILQKNGIHSNVGYQKGRKNDKEKLLMVISYIKEMAQEIEGLAIMLDMV